MKCWTTEEHFLFGHKKILWLFWLLLVSSGIPNLNIENFNSSSKVKFQGQSGKWVDLCSNLKYMNEFLKLSTCNFVLTVCVLSIVLGKDMWSLHMQKLSCDFCIISDRALQCSVCMEDFSLGENVRKLPCEHHYHNNCIIPWLELVSGEFLK